MFYYLLDVSLATQFPFQSKPNDWDLDSQPNINATGHLIFDTVNSFLQHWPNTRYRNGHSLVPGTIPVGTLLYHGRADSNVPTEPQWVATDPEHSYVFCRGNTTTGCWQLTLVVTRALNVVYFDGSGAAKLVNGPLETQDIVAWGRIAPENIREEYKRIADLCTWGQKFGVDGFLSEIMLCDFAAGVEVLSFLQLSADNPQFPMPPHRGPQHFDAIPQPGRRPVFSPSVTLSHFEVLHAGSWHNRYPGDTRIQLDLARMRALNRLETAVRIPHGGGSGVDWKTLVQVIVERYQDRFEMVQYLLNITSSEYKVQMAKKVQTQLRVMLQPYLLHSVAPSVPKAASMIYSWAVPIYKLCATSHTSYIVSSPVLTSKLTESEHLILGAVMETNREICRVITRMWAKGVLSGFDDMLPYSVDQAKEAESVLSEWRTQLDTLMGWLDWSVWVKCRPACGPEEICYLPTWPFFGRTFPGFPGGGEGHHIIVIEDEGIDDGWERPEPKCLRRFEPYSF
ncbi:hypothetical protein IW261DRAFT_1554007 [Armillaria novae-zelandiae]|uniref:Uncharacterized protein n=1 Tax=Armillaria novae-zelandiae TaxID=153914 RepID=A0AA39NHC2_9AGAR|nr:hypothetical protein IW261DRAFT_1554007 [Armillaria novae-zelandiae]